MDRLTDESIGHLRERFEEGKRWMDYAEEVLALLGEVVELREALRAIHRTHQPPFLSPVNPVVLAAQAEVAAALGKLDGEVTS